MILAALIVAVQVALFIGWYRQTPTCPACCSRLHVRPTTKPPLAHLHECQACGMREGVRVIFFPYQERAVTWPHPGA
jgi:hypothetical protein